MKRSVGDIESGAGREILEALMKFRDDPSRLVPFEIIDLLEDHQIEQAGVESYLEEVALEQTPKKKGRSR